MAATTGGPVTGLLNLEKDLVCFICTEVLYQPLTLIDCLHTFCGSCLKEWFSHQHQKASRSHTPSHHPYTCPTCRDYVKDARRNAMINTLLDSFLIANPDKNRTADEKEEMNRIYRQGDDIMPKVEPRRRRRRDEDDVARRERQMLDEARERSMRDARLSPPASNRLSPGDARDRSRSRGHDERRDRRIQEREERRQRRERVEAAEHTHRDRSRDDHSDRSATHVSPPPTSPRHPDAVEARRDARTIAHQASLRSIASASDLGTGTGDSLNEAQLMQEIISEGLLDGIDVDNLTEAEQDSLSEVIAEKYRQLHRHGQGSRSGASTANTSRDQLSLDVQNLQLEEADRVSRPRRATGSSPIRPGRSPRSTGSVTETQSRPPAAHSGSELSPPTQERAHHRRASDQSGRQAAGQTPHHTHPTASSFATRSATDLSDQPQSDGASAVERPRHLSTDNRAQTEPRQATRASELWGRQATAQSRQIHITGPSHQSPQAHNAVPAANGAAVPHVDIPRSVPADPEPVEIADSSTVRTTFEEPSVACFRCSRKDIQYEVHHHCYPCGLDLCKRCYRNGYGCNHWFGFGHGAITKFEASHPHSRNSQQMELPHVLVGRQYLQPPVFGQQPSSTPVQTSSDPSSRLQEGHFCDRCGSFANSCFWACDTCNEGEWGLCNSCVNSHHCCSHPLLPIAHKSFEPATPNMNASLLRPSNSPAHSAPSSATSMTDVGKGPEPDFVNLSITTHCDVCTQPIPPSNSRYHCSSHPTPSPQDPNSTGDYDICTSCYHNLIKIARIKRDDGPAGWRKCPHGHRMIVTAFESDADSELRRVIVRDLVGGVKMSDEDVRAWSDAMIKDHPAPSAMGRVREWTWHDPADPAADPASAPRRTRTKQAALTPQNGGGASKFPPEGGFGKTYVALWSYHPEEGEGGQGELMFPKRAELREVEEINEEWSEGVYAGDRGLVPNVYVREVQ